MINIFELIQKAKQEGYQGDKAEARVCQDILLLLLSKTVFRKNITIKGGVVMRSISNNSRRATLDLDFDFIKYPLTDEGIKTFVKAINDVGEITISINGEIEDLKHLDYKGKRVHLVLNDILDFGSFIIPFFNKWLGKVIWLYITIYLPLVLSK